MARRVVLIGFLVVVEPGTFTQLVLGTTFSFIYFIAQMQIVRIAAPDRSVSSISPVRASPSLGVF